MNDEKILFTVKEIAACMGFSEGTLRHWISQRRIPVVRISARCVRLRRQDVEDWIATKVIASATRMPKEKEK